MKILIASDLYWPMVNGVATFARNLAWELAKLRHEVVVVAPSPTGRAFEEQDGNYRIVRTLSVPAPFYPSLRFSVSPTREIRQVVKKFQPDIIHVQTPLGIGIGAVMVAKKYDVPLVATNHGMSENVIENLKLLAPIAKQADFMLRQYGNRFYRNADFVTLPTEAAIKMLKSNSFTKPHRAISCGIDLQHFSSGEPSPEVWEKFGLDPQVPVVMYLGRVDAEKHLSVLVKAAARLEMAAQVVIVGSGNDSEHLRELIRELGVAGRVFLAGRVSEDDKLNLLRAARLFAMTSPAELQSIATLEAMACGLPVVAVNAGALSELCHDGDNGFLFPLDDDVALAVAIERVLSNSELVVKMGKLSAKIAHQHDLATVIQEFVQLYEQVIRDWRPSPNRLALGPIKIPK